MSPSFPSPPKPSSSSKPPLSGNGSKPKMSKAERKEKYTRMARERSVKQAMRAKGQRLTCFFCRQRGHMAETCPRKHDIVNENNNAIKGHGNVKAKCCYKCGSTEHGLSHCPRRHDKNEKDENALPFAECFVCGQKGHLASQCAQNEKGIYVNGGACKTCGSKQHLSKVCPQRSKATKDKKQDDNDDDDDDDEDDAVTEKYYADMLLHGQGDEQMVPRAPDSGEFPPQKVDTHNKLSRPSPQLAPHPKKKRVVKF